jgi:A/G-specific adenine glycosylase
MTRALHTSPYTAFEPEDLERSELAGVAQALLDWYARERRQLPWRLSGDPYSVWISEIMLQQTQVATVIDYYERWMKRFPDVAALAAAETEDVLHAWQGLGYYSRARNLREAARQIVASFAGRLPESIAELRSLPGIGPYSAGAIASIAFGADEPVVDGNIVRVLTRLFCLTGDPKRAPLHGRIWALARALLPSGRASDFNQALMELGATCCTPRAPRCSLCPISAHCAALKQDRVQEFPHSSPRPSVLEERRAAAVVVRRGRVLVVQAPARSPRWAGMWQFPDVELGAEETPGARLEASVKRSTGLAIEAGASIGKLRHQVTRFRIDIDVYACRARQGRARAIDYDAVCWSAPEELPRLAMPAAHRKIARDML